MEHPLTRFTHTPHLVDLIATAERLAGVIRSAEPDETLLEELHGEAAVASLRLDGSGIEEPPDLEEVLEGTPWRDTERPIEERAGNWLDAFGEGEVEDAEVLAVEYRGVRAGLAADDVGERLLTEPEDALAELHVILTRGLLGLDDAGRIRRTDQAVHDASVGRVIYRPAEADRIPTRLALLGGWLVSSAAREHALVVSGIAHLELLSIHPYEAANGRLARTASRLLLRARGLDPHGTAIAETVLAEDPLGYHEEVAATHRRRDVTVWLERWGESVTGGLRRAAHHLGLLEVSPSERAERFVEGRDRFTVADYRAAAEVGPEEARADLGELLDAGRIRRVPGSRGLRFAVGPQDAGVRNRV